MRFLGIIVAIVLLAIAAAGATIAFAQFPVTMMGAGGAVRLVATTGQATTPTFVQNWLDLPGGAPCCSWDTNYPGNGNATTLQCSSQYTAHGGAAIKPGDTVIGQMHSSDWNDAVYMAPGRIYDDAGNTYNKTTSVQWEPYPEAVTVFWATSVQGHPTTVLADFSAYSGQGLTPLCDILMTEYAGVGSVAVSGPTRFIGPGESGGTTTPSISVTAGSANSLLWGSGAVCLNASTICTQTTVIPSGYNILIGGGWNWDNNQTIQFPTLVAAGTYAQQWNVAQLGGHTCSGAPYGCSAVLAAAALAPAGGSGAQPQPTAITLTSGSAPDNSASGALIATLNSSNVTMSLGGTFGGTCSVTDTNTTGPGPGGTYVASGGASGCNIVTAAAYTSALDGTHGGITLKACQNGGCASQAFTLTITGSAVAAVYPTSIFTANDTTSGLIMAFFSFGGTLGKNVAFPTSGTCEWSGDSIATAFTAEMPTDPFGVMGCGIETNRNLSTGDNGTHTGTITASANGNNYSSPITINVGGTPTTMPPNMNDSMAAFIGGQQDGYFNLAAGVPDVTAVPSGGLDPPNNTPCSVNIDSQNWQQMINYTSVLVDLDNTGGCGATDWHQAALGNYNAKWKAAYQSGAQQTYNRGYLAQLLLMSEWEFDCREQQPQYETTNCGGSLTPVSAADFVAAVENFVQMIHTTFPGVFVGLQGPLVYNNNYSIDVFSPELANGTTSALDFTGLNTYLSDPNQASVPIWQQEMCPATEFNGSCIMGSGSQWAATLGGLPYAVNENCATVSNYNNGAMDGDGYLWPRYFWYMSQVTHFYFNQVATISGDGEAPGCVPSTDPTDWNTFLQMVSPYNPTAKYYSPLCSTSGTSYPGGGSCSAE